MSGLPLPPQTSILQQKGFGLCAFHPVRENGKGKHKPSSPHIKKQGQTNPLLPYHPVPPGGEGRCLCDDSLVWGLTFRSALNSKDALLPKTHTQS